MKKFYSSVVAILLLFSFNATAQNKDAEKGSVIFKLDNSKNENKPVEAAYIILDKYDLTGAGVVKQVFEVGHNKIVLQNIPVGKYYADIYTKGAFKQHFNGVIKITGKAKSYTFKLEAVSFYESNAVSIPEESDDYFKNSVVLMK